MIDAKPGWIVADAASRRRRLPPLNALRAFEAAARNASFSKAAAELSVTPGAISRHITELEGYLGVKLFHRSAKGVALSDFGAKLAPGIGAGFDQLHVAFDQALRRSPLKTELSLTLLRMLERWFLSRLGNFYANDDGFDVKFNISDNLLSRNMGGFDLGIAYGRGTWPDVEQEYLMSADIFPVCSPSMVAGSPHTLTPRQIADWPLIHVGPDNASLPNWRDWFAAYGLARFPRGIHFPTPSLAVEYAAQGHGLALASLALVENDLIQERLVRPLGPNFVLANPNAFFLIWPKNRTLSVSGRRFLDWLKMEVPPSSRDLRAMVR
ncbi:LysR substrate-binding domain-containing protein [Rhodomicrobium lacus]|uniref:LysR substrate-binding domain-containing protein n=1 Tax=Rhodomicrobium lacus TaxID=2498452 RepID=UPI0013DFDD42|nr:LysR substrate-binding domain-containing protein [Rhodomicrobium lacus]